MNDPFIKSKSWIIFFVPLKPKKRIVYTSERVKWIYLNKSSLYILRKQNSYKFKQIDWANVEKSNFQQKVIHKIIIKRRPYDAFNNMKKGDCIHTKNVVWIFTISDNCESWFFGKFDKFIAKRQKVEWKKKKIKFK